VTTWLEQVRERARQRDLPDPYNPANLYQPGSGRGYAQAALDAEIQRVNSAENGTRNLNLNRAAFSLGQLVAGGELDRGTVERNLTDVAQSVGLPMAEIVKTLRSGLNAGAEHPRQAPERPGSPPTVLKSVASPDGQFWETRSYLKHIRAAAHARQRSAPAVLGVVLARAAAMVSHRLHLPAIVGAPAGLSLITVVLAPPGVGKSTANQIGAMLIPPHGDVADQLPIGSGEGFAEVFFGMVDESDDQGKPQRVRQQVRHNAYWFVDEGQVLGELGTRRNATLLPAIRSAFTGATLGQMNASEERRRIVPSGSYTIGMTVAMQTVLAGALLDDAEGGTPQRMLWLPAIDPTIPDGLPSWPGRLPWSPPGPAQVDQLQGEVLSPWRSVYLPVAESVKAEIRAADLQRARGQTTAGLLDAHEGLLRLKVAALLAILDGRLDLVEEDWHLAEVVKGLSDATRASVEQQIASRAGLEETQKSARLARRAADADAVVAQRRMVDCSRKIAEKVWVEPERWTRKALLMSMRRWRDVFDEGLDSAVAQGWVSEVAEPGQGSGQRGLRPGGVKPR
jgi:hypothetical protein